MHADRDGRAKAPTLRSNFIWNTSYQVVRMLTPIITTPYLARVLGSDALGTYSYTYTITTYFTYFCLLGLSQYGNREVAKAKKSPEALSEVFSSILVMQLAVGAVVVALYLGYAFFLSGPLLAYSLIWIIWVLAETVDISWLFYGLEEFKTITIRNVVIRVLLIVGIFSLVRSPGDLGVYCLLQASTFALNSAVLWGLVRSRVRFTKPTASRVVSHLKPNLVLFLPVIAISVYSQLNEIILGNICGMTSVAYYDNAYKIISISLTVIQSLGTVMLPRMSALVATGDSQEIKRNLEGSILVSQLIAYCFMFGIIGISSVFVPVFFGPGFEPCALLMCIFALTIPLCGWSNVLGVQFLIPFGKDSAYLKSVLFGALANIAICILMIPLFGVYGAAFATLFAELVVTITQVYFAKSELDLGSYFKKGIPFALFGIIELFAVVFASSFFENAFFGLVGGIAAGGLVYAAISFLWLKKERVL